MALLEKIRVRFGVLITVVIALALLSFIIDPNTLATVSDSLSSKNDVGEINGKSVSAQDFQRDVDNLTTIVEMSSGSSVHSAEQQEYIRNLAWQALVDKYLVIKNAKAAGINVCDAEKLDLISGDMVSPMVAQNPAFMDENGNFSSERLVSFIREIPNDRSGNLKAYWDFVQNSVYTQQFSTKYFSLFANSNVTNPLMLENRIADNNNTTDVEFVMVPYSYQIDSTIVVSDKEIKDYYNAHKKFYKQPASRDIEYVLFEVVPSKEDIQETNNMFVDSYDEFAAATNLKSFLLRNSDRPYSEYWYKNGELNTVSKEVNDFVFSNKNGVSPVFQKDETFYAARIMATAKVPDSVYVRHILLSKEDEALADSLMTVLKKGKEKFSNLAAMYSLDQNMNVAERGDIGWMTQANMLPGMESVLTAGKNKAYILDTQYGKHIVEVTKTSTPIEKKQVAILERTALASKATYNSFYAKANELAAKSAGKYDKFKAAVEELGLYAHPVNKMLESSNRLGAVEETKPVTRWVYNEAKKGEVSNIITVNNNYFYVVAVKEIHKEGYAPVASVAQSIKSVLYAEKAGVKKAEEVAAKIKGLGSMQAIAEALGTTVSTRDNIAFESLSAQGLDPKFIGAVSVAEEGKISAPLAANLGVYVYKVTGRDTGAFFTEDDAKARDAQMSQFALRAIVPVMMEDAEVVDNRARFY